jgi:hypothetical protein
MRVAWCKGIISEPVKMLLRLFSSEPTAPVILFVGVSS